MEGNIASLADEDDTFIETRYTLYFQEVSTNNHSELHWAKWSAEFMEVVKVVPFQSTIHVRFDEHLMGLTLRRENFNAAVNPQPNCLARFRTGGK